MIDDFKKYLEFQGKSETTVLTYTYHLNDYFRWFKQSFGKPCKKIYRQNILDFKSYMKLRNIDAGTYNNKLNSLKNFNEYLIGKGIQKDIVVLKEDKQKKQVSKINPTRITEDDVKKIMQEILESDNTRNYTIAVIFCYTGVRVSELTNLKVKDIDLIGGKGIIREGKGDKQRTILINSKAVEAIKEYLKVRSKRPYADKSEYLFLSNKYTEKTKGKLNRSSINRILKKFTSIASPHQWRHYFATNALEKGWLFMEVGEQLGHKDPRTTKKYTHPTFEKMKEKAERL